MKILIADDEKAARALLIHFLKGRHPSYIVDEAGDGREALACLEAGKYDIVFLDVKMPGLSGVEILQKLPSTDLPAIIFTTAFEKHALTAFNHNAVDYLLKPFNEARFVKALNKAIDYTDMKEMKKQKNFVSTITIKRGTKTILLPVDEIEFFQAKDDYISVVTATSNYLLSSTLSELENILNNDIFIRVHRSAIINAGFIKKIESQPSGDIVIITKSGKQIRGSRNYKDRIRSLFNL